MKHILILVDSPEMEQFLVRTLHGKYTVTVCRSAEECAALLCEKPDGLILSLFLPGKNGLIFLEDNAPSLPPVIIGLTYFCSMDVMYACAQLGVDCMIRLPCTGKQILSWLDALIGKKDPSLSGG